MTREKFCEWLDTFLNFEKLPQKNIFWLDMMQALSERLAHPELAVPCVHVAGSKGKGSVARMIASILTESGKETGLYTSPHITDFYERVTLNGIFFPTEIYSAAADELRDAVDAFQKETPKQVRGDSNLLNSRSLTWFELVTLYAFLCFRKANVDASVYEVGLGGRLDATNIVQPKISVINTIELEHTEYLGDTLEKIAAEKAGIIKPKTPVISAAATPSVKDVLSQKAAEQNAPIYFADELLENLHFYYVNENNGYFMQTEFSSKIFTRPLRAKMRLLGEVQAQNAFLAAAAVRLAFPEIEESVIERGLENATLRARFEINDSFVLDGAHTVNSIRGTLETFDAIFGNRPAHLLFACAADKDVEHIAALFKKPDGAPRFSCITLTVLNNAKKSNGQKCAEAFTKAGLSYIMEEDLSVAFKNALEAAKKSGAVLLATGSFYLAADIIKNLEGL